MKITAIILNYKNYQDVHTCISSLKKQSLPKDCLLNVLIIDNNSEDNSTKHLQEDFPEYQYIYNKENYGFAKGVNQGINLSLEQSDYFLLTNNDAELDANCLNLMLEKCQNKSIVGPAIYYKNEPNRIWQGGGFFSKLKMNIKVSDKNKIDISKEMQRVDFISGCIMLIPKNVIEPIGKFDENFFFYGEDLDFCLRAKAKNIPVIYCPEARAWHNIKRIAISRTSPFVLKNLAFSYQLIIKKHFPRLRNYGLFLFIFLYTPFRFYQIISGNNNPSNIRAWISGGIEGWKVKI